MGAFFRRLLALFHRDRLERDLDEELAFHLAMRQEQRLQEGFSPAQAEIVSRRRFGNVLRIRERTREAWVFAWLESVVQDIRIAFRGLQRSPGFTVVAVVTLALGIGANTAIFSAVHAVLLSPLPFKNAERLVQLYENIPAAESPNGRARRIGGMDLRELIELKAHTRTLSHVIGQAIALVSVAGGADVVQRELTFVSAAAFPMLDVQPTLGRWFTPEDEREGNDKVIILSYGAWQRYFGGDPRALGRTLAFNGNTFSMGVALGVGYTVVGVMPPDFRFPDDNTQFWAPFAPTIPTDGRPRRVPGMMARLGDGVSLEAAVAETTAILRGVRGSSAVEMPGPPRFEFVRVQEQVGDSVKPALLVLTGAVGLVLLIACANVANLLLARTSARQREIAIRTAIGAGRGRLIRQLLTESVLLSTIGGIAGTVLAVGGVRLFRNLATDLPRVDLGSLGTAFPRLDAIGINAPVFGFAVAVSLGTGIVFGILPAVRNARRPQMDALRSAAGSTDARLDLRGRFRVHDVLIVSEIAMSTVLFVGGGLLMHSFVKLSHVHLGYDPTNVVTFQVGLPGTRRPAAELKTFAEELVTRLQSVPGVEAAAYANQLPLVALENSLPLRTLPTEPYPQPPSSESPDVRLVSRDYLKVMGISVVAGRTFDGSDGPGRPRGIVINRTLARRDFAERNPVGTTVYLGRDPVPWEIIGVVNDVRQAGLDREPRPQIFVDVQEWTSPGVPVFPVGAYYAVRTTADSASVIGNVRDVIRAFEPRASFENIATMDQIVSNRLSRPRMYTVLLGIFAGIAVVLAAAGIYGVIAYAVVRRTKEIGIRMALGAQRAQVVVLVLRHSATLTLVGLTIGLAGATAATRSLEGMLFGITALDVTTFAAVACIFIFVAMLASYLPARRATKVDPLVALRCE